MNKRLFTQLFILLSLIIATLPAMAVVELYEFSSETERDRYNDFVEELRCPKCDNQNLAGSNSPIAADLRRELHRLLQDGRSDIEIVDFMVHRYGDYVLYRPPLQKNTLVLWGLPLVLVCIGLLVFALILYRRRQSSVREEQSKVVAPLSAQEQQKLQRLLTEQQMGAERGGDSAPMGDGNQQDSNQKKGQQ